VDRVPPDDPEDWSDDEWLAWLDDTDVAEAGQAPGPSTHRSRSFGSRLLYAGMFGLHEAIYGPREQVTIVEEADGQPDEPESLEIHLEPDHPEESTVVVRPWLFDGHRN
jgi:hypothetical protein